MKPRLLTLVLVAPLIFLFLACEQLSEQVNKLTATKIKDILDHPRDYENKEVTIYGTVTNAASLLVFKYFEIEDETGKIKVMTERMLPQKGERLQIKGALVSVEVGPERWLVLREKAGVAQKEKSNTSER
ncbi:MAG: hypothetical protein HYV04_02045 [Deltaproteobacteria bacterium]|nr:hypothetical protein [Deltaproteobacteria bacterium]